MTPFVSSPAFRIARRLTHRDIGGLVALLDRLDANGDGKLFRPHASTREAVTPLADPACRDEYLVVPATSGDDIIAYGMLRGWEEGYAVPSLGIAVDPACRGRGLGRGLLRQLHARALARGARVVRLTVDTSNAPALALYTSFGYAFRPLAADRLVGTLELEPAVAVIRSRAAA